MNLFDQQSNEILELINQNIENTDKIFRIDARNRNKIYTKLTTEQKNKVIENIIQMWKDIPDKFIYDDLLENEEYKFDSTLSSLVERTTIPAMTQEDIRNYYKTLSFEKRKEYIYDKNIILKDNDTFMEVCKCIDFNEYNGELNSVLEDNEDFFKIFAMNVKNFRLFDEISGYPKLPIGKISINNSNLELIKYTKEDDKYITSDNQIKDFAIKMLIVKIRQNDKSYLENLYENHKNELPIILENKIARDAITEGIIANFPEMINKFKKYYPEKYQNLFDTKDSIKIHDLDYYISNNKIEDDIESLILNGAMNIKHTSEFPDIKILCAMPIERHLYKGYGYNENELIPPLKIKIEYKGHMYEFISKSRVRPIYKKHSTDRVYMQYLEETLLKIQDNMMLKDFIKRIDFENEYGLIKHFSEGNGKWSARIGDIDVYGKVVNGEYKISNSKRTILDLFKVKEPRNLSSDEQISIYQELNNNIKNLEKGRDI